MDPNPNSVDHENPKARPRSKFTLCDLFGLEPKPNPKLPSGRPKIPKWKTD